MKRKRCFLLLFFVFSGNFGFAQQEETCKSLVIGYIQQMAKVQKPMDGETYYMNVTIENTAPKDKQAASGSMNAEVWLSSHSFAYQSEEVDIYQDSLNAVAIMHKQKRIIRAKGKVNNSSEMGLLNLGSLQESFMERATVGTCKSINWEGKDIQLIDLRPHEEDQLQLKVKYITLYYDKDEERVYKVVVSFDKDQPLIRQTITYNTVDFKRKKYQQIAALENVMDKKGMLLPKYAHYSYLDNR